jgi:hypothetical protein
VNINRKQFMQAEVLVRASHLHLITDQSQIDAAIKQELFHNNKKVLIYKPASEAVGPIFKEFSLRKDLANRPFRLSHKEKSIMATDQWGEVSRLTSKDFSKFVSSWFSLAEFTTFNEKRALVMAKELPLMMVPTYSRFVTAEILSESGMEWVD